MVENEEVKPVPTTAVGRPQLPQSIKQQLQENWREAQQRKTHDIAMPGYSNQLFLTFRALDDYAELRRALTRRGNQRRLPPAQRDLQVGVDMMLAAAVGSYALVDDGGVEKRFELPALGKGLWDSLWDAEPGKQQPMTDSEAVYALFGTNTVGIMRVVTELDQWSNSESAATDEETLKAF